MPTTLRNTDILFNDGTTQSTAGGAPTTAQVLAATAAAARGAVGTYAVRETGTTQLSNNATFAGSLFGEAGTWRVMKTWFNKTTTVAGYSGPVVTNNFASLCLRIS